MKQMQEAVPEEDFERMEKGLPPIKKPVEKRPSPALPEVKDRLDIKTINFEDVTAVTDCKLRPQRNAEGVVFLGYEVGMATKKGPIMGWLPETEFYTLRRHLLGRSGINTMALTM